MTYDYDCNTCGLARIPSDICSCKEISDLIAEADRGGYLTVEETKEYFLTLGIDLDGDWKASND